MVGMLDDLQVGFSLGSDNSSGNALSNNTTLENNGTKKPIYVDTAFGKWTPINDNMLDAGGDHREDVSTVPSFVHGLRSGLHAGRRGLAGNF